MKLPDGWLFTPRLDVVSKKIVVEQSELVRCRNCRHYNVACCNEGCGWCENSNLGTWDEWFCADGEVRGDDNAK